MHLSLDENRKSGQWVLLHEDGTCSKPMYRDVADLMKSPTDKIIRRDSKIAKNAKPSD